MTVIDSSAVVDYLVGEVAASEVEALLARERSLSAPDLLVFEVLAVLRRHTRHGLIDAERATVAIEDLGDLGIDFYPTLPLRERAWALRDSLTVADALFVALAKQLGERLATKDGGLARAARLHAGIDVLELGSR